MATKGKWITVEMTAAEAIDCAACGIEELTDEMTSWRDGMEEKLSHTEKYERVSEAADALENSDARNYVESIEQAISGLEGTPFKAGCPEHVVGTKCPRCGWKGVPRKAAVEPTIRVCDEPYNSHGARLVAQVYESQSCSKVFVVEKDAGEDRIAAERERAQKCFESLHAEWAEHNAPEKLIPRRLPDEPEVLGLDELECIGDSKVSWQELQPYKGKSKSRADRLSDATTAGKAGIEAMREALDKYEEAHKDDEQSDAKDDAADRIQTLRDALDELEGALDELDGIEFPGMYG